MGEAADWHCCVRCKRGAARLRHENPTSPYSPLTVRLRRLPLPTRRHRAGGPLVSALRLSYRDVEELLTERGIKADHVTVYRWVQRSTPLLAEAARADTPSVIAGASMRPT